VGSARLGAMTTSLSDKAARLHPDPAGGAGRLDLKAWSGAPRSKAGERALRPRRALPGWGIDLTRAVRLRETLAITLSVRYDKGQPARPQVTVCISIFGLGGGCSIHWATGTGRA
jgi:hypothetical protein